MSIINQGALTRISQNTERKTITVLQGKNLFNKDIYVVDKYLNSTGVEVSDGSFSSTAHIPVAEGSKVYINQVPNNAALYTIFYNNGRFLSSLQNTALVTASNVLTVPAGATTMRMSIQKSQVNTIQIEYGTTGTVYEPFSPFPRLPDFKNAQLVKPEMGGFSSINFPHGKNLFNKATYTSGKYLTASGTIINDGTYSISDYIPVVAGSKIIFNQVSNSSAAYMVFYKNRLVVSSVSEAALNTAGRILSVPQAVDEVRITFRDSFVNTLQLEYGVRSTTYEAFNPVPTLPSTRSPQKVVLTTSRADFRETDKYIYGKFSGAVIGAVNENHVIFIDDTLLRYTDLGINEEFKFFAEEIKLSLDITTLPSIQPSDTFSRVHIMKTSSGYITLIFTTKNDIYYSSTGVFSGFQKSDIWAMEGAQYKHPSIGAGDKDPTGKRFRFYQPADKGSRSSQFTWFNGGRTVRFESTANNGSAFVFGNYQLGTGATAVPSCLFATNNGKDIYVEYMFGIHSSSVKKAGTGDYIALTAHYGEPLNTTAITNAYVSGLTLRSRINIVPSSADKNPAALFELGGVKTVTAITKANPAVITVGNSTGIEVGTVVYLEGDASDSEWNALRNLTATTTSGGNGRFYIVTAKAGNNLTISETIGSPDNNLVCRHIHAVNDFANGLVIGAGEAWPEGWMVYVPVAADLTSAQWASPTLLNKTETSLQRTIGVYLRGDNRMVFASDEQTQLIPMTGVVVDGTPLSVPSNGMYVGSVSDIDDRGSFENKIWGASPFFKFEAITNSVLFASTYMGMTYISFDGGENWEFVSDDGEGVWKTYNLGKDKKGVRSFFKDGYFIELK